MHIFSKHAMDVVKNLTFHLLLWNEFFLFDSVAVFIRLVLTVQATEKLFHFFLTIPKLKKQANHFYSSLHIIQLSIIYVFYW